MTNTQQIYRSLGFRILREFQQNLEGSTYCANLEKHEHKALSLPFNMFIRFTRWARGKPYHLILFHGTRYFFELDLSRVVINAQSYSLYLTQPTHKLNKEVLNNSLKWNELLIGEYREAVKKK